MEERHGYRMALIEGYRSPERQARLFEQGSHVTQARANMSYHQHGLAADLAFFRDGKVVISERDPWAMRGYELYGEIAEQVGLTWGGRWKMRDLGHVELRRKGVLGRATGAPGPGRRCPRVRLSRSDDMGQTFLRIGGCLMATAFVWGLVLGWWQPPATSRRPSTWPHLGALPLALIGGYFLLRGFIDHLALQPVAAPAGAATLDKAPRRTRRQGAAAEGPQPVPARCLHGHAGRAFRAALLAAIASGERRGPAPAGG
jgi:peptidoglycan L-alanyl-D-glutamate endopeptidase CwlK